MTERVSVRVCVVCVCVCVRARERERERKGVREKGRGRTAAGEEPVQDREREHAADGRRTEHGEHEEARDRRHRDNHYMRLRRVREIWTGSCRYRRARYR